MADRGGHDRRFTPAIRHLSVIRQRSVIRGGSLIRRAYAGLIAIAVAIVVFQELTSSFARVHPAGSEGAGMPVEYVVWALPALALGAAAGAALVVASGSQAGLAVLVRLGVPGLGTSPRARANGLAWGGIGALAVGFTGEAFEVLPGGQAVAATVIGSLLGFGAFRLHRHAIDHEAYRTFNLVAMLLAVGSLASMSITPTGSWWTHNFSTLGTSDDIAAACFNVALIVSGAGMAGMSRGLTRAVAAPGFAARRGGLATMRVLIVTIGLSLTCVGMVPIDGATDLHNAAASAAAAAFAVLCLGVQLWARRLPRALVAGSYLSIAIEVIALIAYDGIGVFNLTVFEIVAFALVFVWLIALVAITHASIDRTDAASRRHLARSRPGRRPVVARHASPGRERLASPRRRPTREPPDALRSG
ncbi:hypothetical protein ACFWN7_12670 [Agromyces sp. NPDC058484]|uniref:hypothetical protein n=1 Tax=Agromyces sp. NPDC058484 TaxID=3346524 RepID=UPI003646E17B